MAHLAEKREDFINQECATHSVVNAEGLEERVRYNEWLEKEWLPFIERFLERYFPNGRFERYGQTEECLKVADLYAAYADNRISRKRRERYDTHLQGCGDCRHFLSEFQNYLAQTRTPDRMAALGRAAVAVPYRAIDYLSERLTEIRQQEKQTTLNH